MEVMRILHGIQQRTPLLALRPTVCTCTMLEEKRKHTQMEKEALATCETE